MNSPKPPPRRQPAPARQRALAASSASLLPPAPAVADTDADAAAGARTALTAVQQPLLRRSLPLVLAVLLLGAGGLIVAAAAAYGLMLVLDTTAPWVAALGAAIGALVAGLPLVALVLKLSSMLPMAGAGAGGGAGPAAADAPRAGIPRALFIDLAEREFARARRYGSGAALLVVDIDRHAKLCEARGAGAGDAVLAAVLQQTAPTLRPADLLTRASDTQMAVFLAHADATGALDVAERIRERTEQLEVPDPQTTGAAGVPALRVTVSVGVAHLRAAHLHLRALLDDADDAVVAARQAGGNCVRAAPVDSLRARAAGGWHDDRRAKPKPGRPS